MGKSIGKGDEKTGTDDVETVPTDDEKQLFKDILGSSEAHRTTLFPLSHIQHTTTNFVR